LQREEGERGRGESVELMRDTIFGGGGQEIISLGLKVPRQCPLVLLVEVLHKIGINFYMTMEGLHQDEMLIIPLGGLHVKQAVQR
jgi:hypothetical protein